MNAAFEMNEDTTPAEVAEYVKSNLPQKTYLYFVDRDESFSPDQVQTIFRGDEYEVEQEILEMYRDSFCYNDPRDTCISDIVGSEGLARLQEDADEYQVVLEACEERDASTVMDDLWRNTGNMLIRYRLRDDWADFPVGYGVSIRPEFPIEANAMALAVMFGVDFDAYQVQMTELLANASYGGSPEFIFYTNPKALADAIKYDENGKPIAGGFIIFDSPYALVMDNLNGSGHDVQLNGATITVPFDPSRLVVDKAKGNGYGWDDVCGLYQPAYATEVTIHASEKVNHAS